MSTPNIYLDFENRKALFESKITRTKTQVMAADLDKTLQGYASAGFFDTGLLPVGNHSGLLALRGGFGHLQIVFQVEPGLQHVIWGKSERDTGAGHFQLAQPYRIWVADFYNGNISGARHFYSPIPINSPDDKLYHVNLPNTNCRGYNSTGVGWMCLYHTDDTTKYSVKQLIEYAYQRAGGGEAYNDRNMSETDGPRFYKDFKRPDYFWDPNKWQAKSFHDGYEWTLDVNLLIPIMVQDQDHQSAHGGSHHLCINDVMDGTYNSYYQDKWPLKPVSALKRGLLAEKHPNLMSEFLSRAIQANAESYTGSMFGGYEIDPRPILAALRGTSIVEKPPIPQVTCHNCGQSSDEDKVQMIVVDFPDDIEQFLQTPTYPICINCDHLICDVRVDYLYTAGPDNGGFNVDNVKTYTNKVYNSEALGRYPSTNPNLLVPCSNCNTYHPRYAKQWGFDIDVYDRNDNLNIVAVSGCIVCLDHSWCNILNLNVDQDRIVNVTLINHFVNPPVPYQASVADWLVMQDDSPYKVCACGIVSSCDNHVGTHNDAPVCGGCQVDGEFVSAFPVLIKAVKEQYNLVEEPDYTVAPVYVEDEYDEDEYEQEDPWWGEDDEDVDAFA